VALHRPPVQSVPVGAVGTPMVASFLPQLVSQGLYSVEDVQYIVREG